MTHAAGGLVLPDTNVVVHIMRDTARGGRVDELRSVSSRGEQAVLSSVVEAELLSLASYRGWGDARRARLKELLEAFVRVDAGHPEVVSAYVELYVMARAAGRYKEFRQNDLWVAATARATRAVVYTCNWRDFEWIDPQFVRVVDCS